MKKWPPVPDDAALVNPLRPPAGAKEQRLTYDAYSELFN
jgi:hypothetical protein